MFFKKRCAEIDFRSIQGFKRSMDIFPTVFKQDVFEQFKSQLLKLVTNTAQFVELNSGSTKPLAFELAKDIALAKQIVKTESDVKYLFAHTQEADTLAIYCLLNTLFSNNCAPKECLDFSILH